MPDGLEPLLVTGNSKDIPSLYKRYLSTIIHVNSWYEDDIFNPETKGYKSIRQVRMMHRRVQQLMNERFQVRDLNDKPRLWMTQYDVALTQFAFIGLAMIFPQKSAMVAADHNELELINYYWRVLGWLMGMKDEFNGCQFDKYEDILAFNKLILQHEYKDRYEERSCETGLEMTKAICVALQYYTPLITFNSLAHWWQDCFKFNGYELKPLSAKEKLLNFWTDLSFNRLLKYDGFMRFSNRLHKKRFHQRLRNKDKVHESLKEQYRDCPHLTFYSDRVDYFGDKNGKQQDGKQILNGTNAFLKHQPVDKIAGDDNNNEPSDEKSVGDEISKTKSDSNTIFQGCPFGYETILPPLVESN